MGGLGIAIDEGEWKIFAAFLSVAEYSLIVNSDCESIISIT
jgi:hypothetical protein